MDIKYDLNPVSIKKEVTIRITGIIRNIKNINTICLFGLLILQIIICRIMIIINNMKDSRRYQTMKRLIVFFVLVSLAIPLFSKISLDDVLYLHPKPGAKYAHPQTNLILRLKPEDSSSQPRFSVSGSKRNLSIWRIHFESRAGLTP